MFTIKRSLLIVLLLILAGISLFWIEFGSQVQFVTHDVEATEAQCEQEMIDWLRQVDWSQGGEEIVFIDESVEGFEMLLPQLAHYEVFTLKRNVDGVEQISNALSSHNKLSALHIISHGGPGSIRLGNGYLSETTLSHYADSLSLWGQSLAQEADILLYGCDVASTENGQAFLQQLSALIGADIAASDDLTGSTQQGGDWQLEITQGWLNTQVLNLPDYPAVLDYTIEQHYTNTSWLSAAGGNSFLTVGAGEITEVGVDVETGGNGCTLAIYEGEGISGTNLHEETVDLSAGMNSMLLSTPVLVKAHSKYTFYISNCNQEVRFKSAYPPPYSDGYYIDHNGRKIPESMKFTIAIREPEIEVQGNSTSISNNDTTPSTDNHTDFGSVQVSSEPVERTFTIQNTGTSMLNLSLPIQLSNTTHFTIITVPSATIAPGSNSIFKVRFNPSATGVHTATVRINNNDRDENRYDFVIQGTGTAPPPPSNQPPQVYTPCPDITVIEGAADHIMNPFDCFSDPEGDHMMFYVTGNSNAQVVPNMSVGQKLGYVDQYAIQFGSVGETDITIQAKETWSQATTEDTFKVTVLPRPTLSISKSASNSSVSAGERVIYTIQISNTGVSTATNALISDTLPAGVTFIADSISASGITTGTVGTTVPILASGVILLPNQTVNLTFAATVNQDVLANQLITNTVQLTSTNVITPVRATHTMQVISPTLSIADASASEREQQLTFIATLSRGSATDVSVEYETVPDVATTDDYTATTGTLTIPASSLTGTISVPLIDDELTEGAESFTLRLSNSANGILSGKSATGTIIDNDSDSDSDGVGAEMEDGVNENGDGNGDGVPDSQQAHVTSLKSGTGDYVTFAAQEGQQLANMSSSMPTEEQALDGVDFRLGLFDFAVTGIEIGAAFNVTLTMHNDGITPNSYWKYGPTADNPSNHWYNFTFDAESGTGAQINQNTITLHFVDGARGDDDLTANGQISDPGGPAIYQPPTTLNLTDLSTSKQPLDGHPAIKWPIWLLVGMMVMIARVVVWQRRRK